MTERVLVIDDDPNISDYVRCVLEAMGYNVVVAADGRQGMDQFRRTGADLVITDLYMPEQEGLETIKQLLTRSPKMPIIAMSGHANAETMLTVAGALGAVVLLMKPFGVEELIAVVARALLKKAALAGTMQQKTASPC